jgi:hypothetical protein
LQYISVSVSTPVKKWGSAADPLSCKVVSVLHSAILALFLGRSIWWR